MTGLKNRLEIQVNSAAKKLQENSKMNLIKTSKAVEEMGKKLLSQNSGNLKSAAEALGENSTRLSDEISELSEISRENLAKISQEIKFEDSVATCIDFTKVNEVKPNELVKVHPTSGFIKKN